MRLRIVFGSFAELGQPPCRTVFERALHQLITGLPGNERDIEQRAGAQNFSLPRRPCDEAEDNEILDGAALDQRTAMLAFTTNVTPRRSTTLAAILVVLRAEPHECLNNCDGASLGDKGRPQRRVNR